MVRCGNTFHACALAISLAISTPLATASTQFESFDALPYVYTQDPARFTSLFESAHSQTIRIAVLGDSQETCPGGGGNVYIPRLNYEAWKVYRNTPETSLVGYCSYGGSITPAEWLLRGGAAAPGASKTRLDPRQILPGITPAAHSTPNHKANINGQMFGQLTKLQDDAIALAQGCQIPTDCSYFDPSGIVRAEIFAATNPNSGEISYRARPLDAAGMSYYAPQTTAGTLALGLASPTFAVKSALTAPLDYAGKRYMQLEVCGDSDDRLTDILGLRFVNESCPQGMVFTSASAGGYETGTFLASHGNSGPLFNALGFHAAIIHTSANDAVHSHNVQEFQADTRALIATVRQWTNDPSFKFILAADPDLSTVSTSERIEFDQYVGAQIAIAQSDPNVLVLNSRRLTHEQGWRYDSSLFTGFVADGVHYTSQGGRTIAAAEFSALSSRPDPDGLWLVWGGRHTAPTDQGSLLRTRRLLIHDDASLDLADKSLLIYSSPSQCKQMLNDLTLWIRNGRNLTPNSPALFSSDSPDPLFVLAAVLNDDGNASPLFTDFPGAHGIPVSINDIIVKSAWLGDANLDGVVNADDYFLIDSNYIPQKPGWYNGDFNYDGVINGDDYFLIDSAFLAQSARLAASASVPEPAPLFLLALIALSLLRSRFRRGW